MKYVYLGLVLLFTACGSEESEKKNNNTPTNNGMVTQCSGLSEKDCISAGCNPSVGYPVDGSPGGYIGCDSRAQFNNASTWGRDPETGECWQFPANGPLESWGEPDFTGEDCGGTNNNTAGTNNTTGG